MSSIDSIAGYITRDLDEGIKSFQRDNGLKIDGALLPGGETERGLFGRLTGRNSDDVFGRSEKSDGGDLVGFGGNVSGSVESKKSTYEPPKYASVFAPPLETKAEKKETGSSDPFTLMRGGMRVNKDKFADGIEKFLLAAGQDGEVPTLEKILEEGSYASERLDKERDVVRSEEKIPPNPEKKPLDSPHRPTILEGIKNQEIIDFTKKEEGKKNYLYKDTAKGGGKVTIGVGHLLNDIENAKILPFMIENDKGESRLATQEEIEEAFKKIDSIKQPSVSTPI